ncbi:MAG: hypothetical protein V1676_04770 [Candidatus Diapherotrites archaeon]
MKRIVFLLVAFILLPSAFAAYSSTYDTILKVGTFSQSPATVYAGDTVNLNVRVENTSGNSIATDVNATLMLSGAYFEPIHVTEQLGTIYAGALKNAVFRFKIKEKAYAGTYKFSVNLSYLNGTKRIEQSYDVNLLVVECYGLDVGNVMLDSYSPHIGETLRITANLSNNCSGEARDVTVKLIPKTNSTLDPFISLSDTVLEPGNIPQGESKTINFLLRVSDKAAPKTYVFNIDANCLDCPSTATQAFSFDVYGKPDLIISGIDFSIEYRTDDKRIMLGDTLTLSVQLDNIGEETAKATKISLAPDQSIEGVLETYVGNIDEDDSGSGLFTLTVNPSAETGKHSVPVTITYRDELDNVQQVTRDFEIYVHQKPAESPIGLLILIIVILVLLYFIIKMVFRQLAMRKA